MKKLTAGIFAGILAIVTVNAARADIATTNYVKGAIGSLDSTVVTGNGAIDTITQTDGKITATRRTLKDADIAGDAAIATSKINGLDTALGEKQTTENLVSTTTTVDGKVTIPDATSTTKYPSMAVAQQIAASAAADKVLNVTSRVNTLEGDLDSLAAIVEENKGAAEDAINGLTGTGTGTTAGNGMVKTVTQANGVVTATRGLVAKADLDTALTTEINGKMATATYTTATTMAADGSYAKKANTVAQNLTALDSQVKTNADAIATANGKISANETAITNITKTGGTIDTKISTAVGEINSTTSGLNTRLTAAEGKITTLTGTGEGSVKKQIDDAIANVNTTTDGLDDRVTANTTAINALDGRLDTAETNITNLSNNKANAADVYTKTEIDGKVSTINTEIGKKVTATNLQNKLLTTNADGQLQDASTGHPKPEECDKNGVTCMLVNDGSGFKWEKIVDTYSAN